MVDNILASEDINIKKKEPILKNEEIAVQEEKTIPQIDREKVEKLAIESGHPDVFPATDMDFENISRLSSSPEDFPITDYDHEVLLNDYKSHTLDNFHLLCFASHTNVTSLPFSIVFSLH